MRKIDLVVSTIDQIQVEGFCGWVGKYTLEALVGRVFDLIAGLGIAVGDGLPNQVDIGHQLYLSPSFHSQADSIYRHNYTNKQLGSVQ